MPCLIYSFEPNYFIALGLTLLAGLSTGIGGLIAFVTKDTNKKFLAICLGFSAGVMIYVSFMEILPEATNYLQQEIDLKWSSIFTVLAFFGGMLIIGIIDRLVPQDKNPHEFSHEEEKREYHSKRKLLRVGLLTAIALAIHNFPEGLATFVSAIQEPKVALPIVFAIAIHNIPEGIAVSAPIYQATKSKKKAFVYSFLSGLAEPLGAVVGWFILLPFMNSILYGIIFAAVAGIMVFISFDELLPAAREYGEHHLSLYGLIGGMAFMAVSLLLFI